ncbi:MAG: mechanosensitive ion channel family protein [Thermodesulfobacteriota bacterium]
MELTTVVTGAWNAFATKVTAFLPALIGAIIIFVVGWIIARLIKVAVERVLKLIRFDKATEKSGIQDFLKKGGVVKGPSEIIAVLAYWFLMIIVITATLDALGIPIVSDLLNDIFLYIPSVVAAIIVLILGFLLGTLISAVVQTAASNAGLKNAQGLGKLSLYAIVVFSWSIALIQLGIGEEIVTSAFGIALGAFALATAIAFGLGGKDVAAEYLKRWLEEKTSAANK